MVCLRNFGGGLIEKLVKSNGQSGVNWGYLRKMGLGFRDLGSSNLAILSKKWWTIIRYPSSLVNSQLKQKYFSKVNFMEAKLGHRPSYVQRSLLAGRDLLSKGLIQRIGNGRLVKILEDPWLNRPYTSRVQSPINILSPQSKVANLFSNDPMEWNMQLVKNIFSIEEDSLISRTPSSKVDREGKQV